MEFSIKLVSFVSVKRNLLNHHFFNRSFSKAVWRTISIGWMELFNLLRLELHIFLLFIKSSYMWVRWNLRNNIIFKEGVTVIENVVNKIKIMSYSLGSSANVVDIQFQFSQIDLVTLLYFQSSQCLIVGYPFTVNLSLMLIVY